MPNWCDNSLEVSGEAKQIKAFKEKAKGEEQQKTIGGEPMKDQTGEPLFWRSDLSIKKFLPIPKALKDRTSPFRAEDGETEEQAKQLSKLYQKVFGADDWYGWCVKNWGTKWDIEATLQNETPKSLQYSFMSAWSPPVEAFVEISKQFPKLKFAIEYEETGVGFYGHHQIKNGQIISGDQGEIEYDKEEECPECGEVGGMRTNTDNYGTCEYCGWHK